MLSMELQRETHRISGAAGPDRRRFAYNTPMPPNIPREPSHATRGNDHPDEFAIVRVIDAATNRAKEGLRVVEDLVRFAWNDAHLMQQIKSTRHRTEQLVGQLERANQWDRVRSRNATDDVGVTVKTSDESTRSGLGTLLRANLRRSQEALRTLSECTKSVRHASEIACQFEQLRFEVYQLETAVLTTDQNRQRMQSVHICALIDQRSSLADFQQHAERLVDAGVGMIQLRTKYVTDREQLLLARHLRRVTKDTKCILIINDRADIAAAVDADGVHLGQDDMPIADARAVVGPRRLIGASTHSLEQAQAAVLAGADYIGVGPVFVSDTKSFDQFPGIQLVEQVAENIGLPAFAIGGIDHENVHAIADAGLRRVAVHAALQESARVPEMVHRLHQQLNRKTGTTKITPY